MQEQLVWWGRRASWFLKGGEGKRKAEGVNKRWAPQAGRERRRQHKVRQQSERKGRISGARLASSQCPVLKPERNQCREHDSRENGNNVKTKHTKTASRTHWGGGGSCRKQCSTMTVSPLYFCSHYSIKNNENLGAGGRSLTPSYLAPLQWSISTDFYKTWCIKNQISSVKEKVRTHNDAREVKPIFLTFCPLFPSPFFCFCSLLLSTWPMDWFLPGQTFSSLDFIPPLHPAQLLGFPHFSLLSLLDDLYLFPFFSQIRFFPAGMRS